MYVNITSGKVDPSNVQELMQRLDNDQVRAAFRKVKGFHRDFLMVSQDAPGSCQSITLWEDEAEAKAFFASPDYLQVVGGIKDLFISPVERASYTILTEF
jgi:quinol monooxygenase YgiN